MKRQPISYLKKVLELHNECNDEMSDWATQYFEHQNLRLAEDVEIITSMCGAGSRVLDVGGAPFYSTCALKFMGINISCLDIGPERFEEFLVKSELHCEKCNVEENAIPFDASTFDVVVLSEVFEHMRLNLISTINELKRVLKPGGMLFLSTPNFFSINRLYRLIKKRRTVDIYSEYIKLDNYGHMGHVREYTSNDVIAFLEDMDFRICDVKYRGINTSTSFQGKTSGILQRGFPVLRNWFAIIAEKR